MLYIVSHLLPYSIVCKIQQFSFILSIWFCLGWASFLINFVFRSIYDSTYFDGEKYFKVRGWLWNLISVVLAGCSIVPEFGLAYGSIQDSEGNFECSVLTTDNDVDFTLAF